MRVGVLSDTHGRLEQMQYALRKIGNIDALIHLGDSSHDADALVTSLKCKIFSVRGNCDYLSNVPLELLLEIEKARVWITHGHKYGVKWGLEDLCRRAQENQAGIVLFGHTHVPLLQARGNILIFNPGSTSLPRGGMASCGVLEIKGGDIRPSIIPL